MPDKTNDYIHLDDLRQMEEYARAAEAAVDNLQAETEMTQDADEARQLDVDRMDLKEEEDYINKNLQDGHYIDGYEVAAIHKKYEKHIGSLEKELEKLEKVEEKDPEKAKKIADDINKITNDINKLKESRNGELQKLCDEAPKYNRSAIRSMMTQQLRNNDAGRVGGDIKVYHKDKGQENLLVTTYGKNRVGEINKMLRQHDAKAADLAGRRAGEQQRHIGHSARDFLQGDAEHMFKGGVSMGLHAFLFILNKAAQAGNKSAQWALYQYARNKLTMDDAEALQKAVNDVSRKNIAKNKEVDIAEQKGWNGTIEPMDFNSPDLPPFEDMDLCDTYSTDPDVRVMNISYIDDDGTRRQGSVYRGTDDDIRQYLSNMGLPDDVIDAELAENAEKVEALGLGNILPLDFSDPNLPAFEAMDPLASYDAEHDTMTIHLQLYEGEKDIIQGKVFIGPEENLRKLFEDMGKSPEEVEKALAENAAKAEALGLNPEKVHGQGYENYMLDDDRAAYEEHMEKNNEDYEEEEDIEEGQSEVALEPGDEDILTDIMGEHPDEEVSEVREDVDPDDVIALLSANNDAKGLVDDTPAQSGVEAPDILEELGGDGMSLD